MELQYIVLTIIKILISVPAIVLLSNGGADCAALIGGHVNNNNSSKTNATYEFKIDLSDEITQELADNSTEKVPEPEPLVVPGYNLPENIFNRGKPFYLEKDPLTGNVDFENKSPNLKIYDEYEYEEEHEHDGIDRRDGPPGSHKNSDINQLTPNFHDFLNLPVKYNPNKYVYPLISNSYANTKVQGNVNKQHNHKNYIVTTYKPYLNPTYYTTRKYFGQKVIGTHPQRNDLVEGFTSSTKVKQENLMNSPMKHYSFTAETTSSSTTTIRPAETSTKKLLSLFEQLFGSDYEDSAEITERIEETTTRPISTQLFTSTQHIFPSSTTQNVLTGSNMADNIHITTKNEYEDYEYEDKSTTGAVSTTTIASTTTTTPVIQSSVIPSKITSLPLGENHVTQSNRQPIIITNLHLRDQLNNEKVIIQAPSTSNIHIAPDQDTVSFVVGNQQSVEGGSPYENAPIAPVGSPYDNNPFRPVYGSDSTIQPIREASLAIGVPVNRIRVKPGQVVDEEPVVHSKIVFPDATEAPVNREVLKLSSKPMFHQLPSDLTPPDKEKIRQQVTRIRPPWDPRPGHFHTGRPEYARPPRPSNEVYKRIDNLPNILPQFRPNMKYYHHHHNSNNNNKNYARQPLLERPSNRPIGFFEKLHPPPPPPPNRRQDDAVKNQTRQEPFPYLHAPPKVTIINRSGNDPETLQMIHAKQEQRPTKKEDKPLYVVYPVNTRPLKLDAIDTNKESVVIGTRAELPLPPSKIQQPAKEFNYEMKERNDAPILKPRPQQFPLKSNFPYPLERPDPSILETPVDVVENNLPDEPSFSSNQWNTIDTHPPASNQISVTLKTYTEKPIAVAYTPTESDLRFSPPNYASLRDEFVMQRPQKLDRIDEETTAQDFQAPFQASAHVDSLSQGWSVVKDKDEHKIEATTLPVATTSEFDIENFKPQLEGGFKPIYNYPDDKKEMVINERQE